jgi:hypothetical protein
MPSAVDRDAARIRDLLNEATGGDVQHWISLDDIRRQAKLTEKSCQVAVWRAADMGWIATVGGREVHSVRMTDEGCRPRAR